MTERMSDERIAEIQSQLNDTQRARDMITMLGGPKWHADRPKAPLVIAVEELLAEVKRQRAEPDYRQLIINFCAGLSLSDHMGDVADDVVQLLDEAHIEVDEWDDLSDLRKILGRQHGAKYLGTNESVIDDEDEEDEEDEEDDEDDEDDEE